MADSSNAPTPRKNYHQIPTDLLNDLSSRFIINVPEEERVDLIRVCFQIELAHWFYLDFYCEEDSKLPKCSLKDFIRIIFGHIPFLQEYSSEVDGIIADWREYKMAVPTYGAILLDQELKNVLLVQSFVFKASWGFPKGKVNQDEQPQHCAIREVLEETGFDITNLIDKKEYLEYYFNDQLIRLYIITGIPPNVKFHPKTRKEIKSIEWFPVNLLPTSKKDQVSKSNLGSINFFMVIPFVKQLRKWIANKTATSQDISHESVSESDKYILQQQHLFATLSQNELAKYRQAKVASDSNSPTPTESRSNRSGNKACVLPPRLLQQKNLKLAMENEENELTKYHQIKVLSDTKSPTENRPNRSGNKACVLPPRLLQQKNLKQAMQNEENELIKFREIKLQSETIPSIEFKPNRSIHKGYSPPPRMIRQKNLKQALENEKKKNTTPQTEERIGTKSFRRSLDFSKETKQNREKYNSKKELVYPYSKTWANFCLDTESLLATFSMGLKEGSPIQQ